MSKNIVLCGVGGQGTILASKLISAAAMAQGLPVKSAETIGMAQRGGSVFPGLCTGEAGQDLCLPAAGAGSLRQGGCFGCFRRGTEDAGSGA